MDGVRLTIRIDFGTKRSIGPGKIRLLEAIAETGSISRAGQSLGMSYRRAWLLVDDLNHCFREPVVTTKPGGAHGGGAALTRFGIALIRQYRSIETQAAGAAKKPLGDLKIALRNRTRSIRKPLRTSIRATASQ
jgi:molybdate transport system regulatory protein